MTGEVEQVWKWIDERAENVRGALHPELARRVMVHRAEKAREEAVRQSRVAQQATTVEDIDLSRQSEYSRGRRPTGGRNTCPAF